MRAGEVQLERIHAARLRPLDEFLPASLLIFLHDRGDQHTLRVHVLAPLEFILPQLERAIADQLDVFPSNDFFAVGGMEFAITRRHVDDFARVERNGFGDDRAPTFFERLADDSEIRARRT